MGTQHGSEIWLGEVNYCAMGFSASCMWVNRRGCLMPNQKWILINSQTCGLLSQLASGRSRSWNCGTLGCRDLITHKTNKQRTTTLNNEQHTTTNNNTQQHTNLVYKPVFHLSIRKHTQSRWKIFTCIIPLHQWALLFRAPRPVRIFSSLFNCCLFNFDLDVFSQ